MNVLGNLPQNAQDVLQDSTLVKLTELYHMEVALKNRPKRYNWIYL